MIFRLEFLIKIEKVILLKVIILNIYDKKFVQKYKEKRRRRTKKKNIKDEKSLKWETKKCKIKGNKLKFISNEILIKF